MQSTTGSFSSVLHLSWIPPRELTRVPPQLEEVLTKLSEFPAGSVEKRLEQITVGLCTFLQFQPMTFSGS